MARHKIAIAIAGPVAALAMLGAASAQPFPQGQCSGLLCSSIGGSQAPPRVGPPPICGGLFCGSIGDPFYPPGMAPQVAAAPPPVAAPVPAQPVKKKKVRKAKKKAADE